MMTFLLQYFLNHQCIHQQAIFKWYNDIKASRYEGLRAAKKLATPFIELLLANQTGKISD